MCATQKCWLLTVHLFVSRKYFLQPHYSCGFLSISGATRLLLSACSAVVALILFVGVLTFAKEFQNTQKINNTISPSSIWQCYSYIISLIRLNETFCLEIFVIFVEKSGNRCPLCRKAVGTNEEVKIIRCCRCCCCCCCCCCCRCCCCCFLLLLSSLNY